MSFKRNKYLFNIFNIMLNEIFEFGIIIYCCYETYNNLNFDLSTEKITKYFNELSDEHEYVYKLQENGISKYVTMIENYALKVIIKGINFKSSVEDAPFIYKIDEKIGKLRKNIFNNEDRKEYKLKINNISKKNHVVHSDEFVEAVDEHFEKSNIKLLYVS